MDGFTGYATAVDHALPTARKVMDPFHVVHLAADKLTGCRQRLQRETTGRRGRKDDPLYRHRRALLTRTEFLTDRQKQRLDLLWDTDDDHVALQVTWQYLPGPGQCVRRAGQSEGEEVDGQGDQHATQGPTEGAGGAGGAGAAGSDIVAPTYRHPRLLRHRRIQRAGRGNQREAGTPTRHRPGAQKPRALYLAVVDPVRATAASDQRTLDREEPVIIRR